MSQHALLVALPMCVAVAVPAAFLYAVRRLDLYASGGFRTVVLNFAGGILAFPAALAVNTTAAHVLAGWLGLTAASAAVWTRGVVAPFAEEALKGSPLAICMNRGRLTYFVDGAVCGFAAGTAFAICENLFYLRDVPTGAALALSIDRAFSTSLMHGSSTALVGVSVARYWTSRRPRRLLGLLVGWLMAAALHLTFNRVVDLQLTQGSIVEAMAVGFAGLAVTAAFIELGLRDERRWLLETLGPDAGVSRGEAAMIQRIEDLPALLVPVEAHFGRQKRDLVLRMLLGEAQLGLRSKLGRSSADPRTTARVEEEIGQLQAQLDRDRREIGVYCMALVRSILPPKEAPIWGHLADTIADPRQTDYNIWQAVSDRAGRGPKSSGDAPTAAGSQKDGG